jgi:hypothetical protein
VIHGRIAAQVGHGELLNSGQLEVGPLDGRDALAKTMVFLVWNFTAANASLTRPSYDAYAYPPARPTVLHAPPPQAKGECTEDSFLRMLPTRGESAVAVGFMHWRSERTTLAAPLLGPQVCLFDSTSHSAKQAPARLLMRSSWVVRYAGGRADSRSGWTGVLRSVPGEPALGAACDRESQRQARGWLPVHDALAHLLRTRALSENSPWGGLVQRW